MHSGGIVLTLKFGVFLAGLHHLSYFESNEDWGLQEVRSKLRRNLQEYVSSTHGMVRRQLTQTLAAKASHFEVDARVEPSWFDNTHSATDNLAWHTASMLSEALYYTSRLGALTTPSSPYDCSSISSLLMSVTQAVGISVGIGKFKYHCLGYIVNLHQFVLLSSYVTGEERVVFEPKPQEESVEWCDLVMTANMTVDQLSSQLRRVLKSVDFSKGKPRAMICRTLAMANKASLGLASSVLTLSKQSQTSPTGLYHSLLALESCVYKFLSYANKLTSMSAEAFAEWSSTQRHKFSLS